MHLRLDTLMCFCILLLCVGCAQTVAVTVSGTNKAGEPIPSHVTYAVLPTGEVEKDLGFPEYAKLVAHHMDARDYKQTTEKAAQLGVYLAYGTKDSMAGNATMPAYPTMGMNSGMGSGTSGGGSYSAPVGTPSNSAGLKTYTNQVVIVVLDLQRSRAAGKAVELWRGETMYTGSSNDLAQLAPLMIEAAFRHFGDTTPDMVRHQFSEADIKKLQESK